MIESSHSQSLPKLFSDLRVDGVKLMKIDTEGVEVIILGAPANLLSSRQVNFIIVEVNSGDLELMDSIVKFFLY